MEAGMVDGNETAPPAGGSGESGKALHFRPRPVPELRPSDLQQIDVLAAELRRADPRISEFSAFGPGVHQGIGDGPCVWFGDTAEIPLLGRNPHKRFDYRLAWLAREGDIVVTGGRECPAFEAYQRRWLSAPGLRYLNVDPDAALPRRATPRICLRDQPVFEQLGRALAGCADVTLHAHITTGTIWALAARLASETGAQFHVAGPPPLLSRRTNDKIWFGDVARSLLGKEAIPPKRTAFSGSALTRHVMELARDWDRLVVKLPDSAGSAGNFPVNSSEVRGLAPAALNSHLKRLLSFDGRAPMFPVLVEVWDANVLTSPSVQTWIGAPEQGPPLIEAIFEQVLYGQAAEFIGAASARLPPAVEKELIDGALRIATLFQRLGYYGRCSFDAILVGRDIESAVVHWIECNGRWGGASIPMSLAYRLARAMNAPHYVIVQNDTGDFRALDFAEAVEEFADTEPSADLAKGVLFLTPNMTEAGTGCHLLAFGTDTDAASALAHTVMRRLRG